MADKIRVALVAPSLRILGGQAVQADRLLRAWRGDPDVEAWLVPHNPLPPWPFDAGVRIKYVRTVVTELTYLPLLVRELVRADVVHVFSASYWSFLLAPMPAVVVAKALGRPVILHYHSGEAPDHLSRSPLARAILARVDRLVVPSPFLIDVFAGFGLQAQAIPNVVSTEFRFRDRVRLQPRLLSTRNFESLYNVACTIRAFRIIQNERPEASLTLVGAGREEAALRALVGDLRLRNVTFSGPLDPSAIAEQYTAHDIYIQSPDIDNAPVSILEAYASGLPVVSTNVGGIPAILTDGRQGLLAAPGDHQALAAHVLRLLADPPLASQLAEAGQLAVQACAWPSVREKWLRVYREMRWSTNVASLGPVRRNISDAPHADSSDGRVV